MPSPIQLQRLPRRKKPAPKRALLFLALLVLFACAGLAGCSAQAADAPTDTATDLKRAAAGVWACPGMTAVWLDEATVQCLKERP
ncbi:MAG: hypothetical protein LBJ15_18360 [Comamonas sp.]|jgi:ABC-type glycerol-3-phosphate transport system substrate-binding protein|uniref:hypothetical protein n=1 Tax=Comamonas sp. TaxID=34028 RepID=UPI0028242884|nr:hypothetical protein [Comamonas sp.]MDR0215941.1 hypothetical protein [Comamonas sp.]